MIDPYIRVPLVRHLAPDDLPEHEAHLAALRDAVAVRTVELETIGDTTYLPHVEREAKEGRRATLVEELYQLNHGVRVEVYSEALTPFLGRPGLTATEVIVARLRAQAARAAVDPDEEHEYRLRNRPPDGNGQHAGYAKFYQRTETGDLRRLRPDETIRLTNARLAAVGDIFERVVDPPSVVDPPNGVDPPTDVHLAAGAGQPEVSPPGETSAQPVS